MPFPFNKNTNLKDVITKTGYKQRFLADKLGVSETMFSHQVAGRRRMNRNQVRLLARILKLRIKDIEMFTLK